MIYFIDTEFNGFGGELLSLALVNLPNTKSISIEFSYPAIKYDPWVFENVVPILRAHPPEIAHHIVSEKNQASSLLQDFFSGDSYPQVVADWPDDIRYLCNILTPLPGQMINIPRISFEVVRVDAYPTSLEGAVRHNAWWDAQALRVCLL